MGEHRPNEYPPIAGIARRTASREPRTDQTGKQERPPLDLQRLHRGQIIESERFRYEDACSYRLFDDLTATFGAGDECTDTGSVVEDGKTAIIRKPVIRGHDVSGLSNAVDAHLAPPLCISAEHFSPGLLVGSRMQFVAESRREFARPPPSSVPHLVG